MKTAIFLERDGILNLNLVKKGEPASPLTLQEFKVNEAAVAPIRQLKEAGFLLIATTNQPAMSEGNICRWELDRMHATLKTTFALDDILICPHTDEEDFCPCHKPGTGLFSEAAFKWHIELEKSYIISDKWQDSEVARTIGATSMLVKSPWIGTGHHDFVLPNVEAIARKIFQLQAMGHAMVA